MSHTINLKLASLKDELAGFCKRYHILKLSLIEQCRNMKSHDLVRVKHMIEAADEAISFVRGKNRIDLDQDRMLTMALMREIEVVGEAASRISEDFKRLHPEIPWSLIIGCVTN